MTGVLVLGACVDDISAGCHSVKSQLMGIAVSNCRTVDDDAIHPAFHLVVVEK